MAVLNATPRALRAGWLLPLFAAFLVAGLLATASAAQAAPKPKMSFKEANKVAVQKAIRKTARDRLSFPANAAQSGSLSWSYGCNQFGKNLAMYWNVSRWFRDHDVSSTTIAGPNDIWVYPSIQRGSTWWGCQSFTFPSPQDLPITYIRLRMEIAGSDAGGITGSTVACEVLYDSNQSIVGRSPNGCILET